MEGVYVWTALNGDKDRFFAEAGVEVSPQGALLFKDALGRACLIVAPGQWVAVEKLHDGH